MTSLGFEEELEDQHEKFEFVHTQLAEAKARQKRLNFWNYLGRFIVDLVLGAGSIARNSYAIWNCRISLDLRKKLQRDTASIQEARGNLGIH